MHHSRSWQIQNKYRWNGLNIRWYIRPIRFENSIRNRIGWPIRFEIWFKRKKKRFAGPYSRLTYLLTHLLQVMHTRDDHVVIVYYPDNTTVVEHADGTRITTVMQDFGAGATTANTSDTLETGVLMGSSSFTVFGVQLLCVGLLLPLQLIVWKGSSPKWPVTVIYPMGLYILLTK